VDIIRDLEAALALAPDAKDEIDDLAEFVAGEHQATLAPADVKSFGRALRKAVADDGGDVSAVRDLARNTIVVSNESDIAAVVAGIEGRARVASSRSHADTSSTGYSGHIIKVRTREGLVAEIQVNTPAMIFAGFEEEPARKILGDVLYERFDQLAVERGLEGGWSHDIYERTQRLPEGSAERERVEEAARTYHDQIRELARLMEGE